MLSTLIDWRQGICTSLVSAQLLGSPISRGSVYCLCNCDQYWSIPPKSNTYDQAISLFLPIRRLCPQLCSRSRRAEPQQPPDQLLLLQEFNLAVCYEPMASRNNRPRTNGEPENLSNDAQNHVEHDAQLQSPWASTFSKRRFQPSRAARAWAQALIRQSAKEKAAFFVKSCFRR